MTLNKFSNKDTPTIYIRQEHAKGKLIVFALAWTDLEVLHAANENIDFDQLSDNILNSNLPGEDYQIYEYDKIVGFQKMDDPNKQKYFYK